MRKTISEFNNANNSKTGNGIYLARPGLAKKTPHSGTIRLSAIGRKLKGY